MADILRVKSLVDMTVHDPGRLKPYFWKLFPRVGAFKDTQKQLNGEWEKGQADAGYWDGLTSRQTRAQITQLPFVQQGN